MTFTSSWFRLRRRLYWVEGEDAESWLQGQVTNDVTALEGAAAYAFLVNTKGRVVADLWALRDEQGQRLGVLLPVDAAETALERFEKYIIMEDVEILAADATLLAAPEDVAPPDGVLAFRAPALPTGLCLWVLASDGEAHAARATLAAAGVDEGSEDAWTRLRIDASLPAFGADFGPETMPQETSLSGIAVSFSKGCYVGQEPVVMLEHRGKPPKRVVAFEALGEITLGAEVMQDGRAVGKVTTALPSEGGTVGFSLIRRKALEAGIPLHVGDAQLRLAEAAAPGA